MPNFILSLDNYISGKYQNKIQDYVVIFQPFVMDEQRSAEWLWCQERNITSKIRFLKDSKLDRSQGQN